MTRRDLDPTNILLPPGYKIEVFKSNLTTPIDLEILKNGDLYIGDSGVTDGNGKLLKLTEDGIEVIADGFNPPLTGITYHKNSFYVSHRGKVTKVTMKGNKKDIISGLPSFGDHHNNRVVFGPDDLMYFGQGTATNSGVVGHDNANWVKDYPFFHDYPASFIQLNGKNFKTENILSFSKDDMTYTGAFTPFGTTSSDGEIIKGMTRASGSILRAKKDGSNLEVVAWGLRNPFVVKFDRFNRLFTTNHGMDVRGSRPIANSYDEFYQVYSNAWYGWPDYTGGYPVTLPHFKPENEKQPEFLLKYHPMLPPKPLATFTPHSAIMGYDFNYFENFGYYGDCFIAEFGPMSGTSEKALPDVGHQISRINLETGEINVFAKNKNHTGGFSRPIDVVFHNHSMYIVDFGFHSHDNGELFEKNSGVIWKVTNKLV